MKVISFREAFDGKIYFGYPEYASAWLKDYDYFAKKVTSKFYILDLDVTDEILYKALGMLTQEEVEKFYYHEKGLTAAEVMLELQTKELKDYPSGRSVKVKPMGKGNIIRV